jgi:hypothetical protein
MAAALRALNRSGVDRFRQYLDALRSDERPDLPRDLLDDPDQVEELSVDLSVEERKFPTRWGVAKYLSDLLEPLPREEVDDNVGLWSWLSLFYFNQVCPVRDDGSRRPGREYRHVPDFSFRYRNRHLLLGPYQVYRRHGPYAILILSGPLYSENKIYHELASRQDLIVNRGIIEAVNALYLDRQRGMPKRGCQDSKPMPGALQRFIRVLQQLDLTYDIHGMTGDDILELLPEEFNPWKAQQSLRGV